MVWCARVVLMLRSLPFHDSSWCIFLYILGIPRFMIFSPILQVHGDDLCSRSVMHWIWVSEYKLIQWSITIISHILIRRFNFLWDSFRDCNISYGIIWILLWCEKPKPHYQRFRILKFLENHFIVPCNFSQALGVHFVLNEFHSVICEVLSTFPRRHARL